ncbi:MAG: hypothetical protein V1688_04580 [bacterium]
MPNHPTKKESSGSDDLFFSFKTLRGGEEEIKQEEKEDEEVINIYHQNMPKKLERKSNKGLKIFLIGIFMLIAFSGIFYYCGKSFFKGVNIFTGDNVELKIEGISQVSAGEKIIYTIKYENLEKIDLSDVVLKVNYPIGFVYEKSRPLPTDQNNNSWDLGYLRSQKSGQIEIAGSLIGEESETKKFGAKLSYRLGGDQSMGSKETEIQTQIASSILTLDIAGPSQLLGGDAEYKIQYSNKSDEAVKDIQILLTYPEDFIFSGSEPIKPQENTGNAIWLINQLDGGQSSELTIKGSFKRKEPPSAENPAGTELSLSAPAKNTNAAETQNLATDNASENEKIIKVQIGILNEDDVFFPQAEKEFTTSIASGDLAVGLKINGKAENSIINLDDTLAYAVDYANKSSLNFQDVQIKLIINSNILDWASLENKNQGIVQDEEIINGMLARSITWEIENIKEGEEGSFAINIKTKPYSKLDKTNSLDLKTEARTKTIIGKIDGAAANKIIESEKIIAQVNTELNLETKANLQNDNEYELVWQLTNTIHEVENVKVEAVLPQEINWMAQSSVSAGDIYFDPEAKKVSWQLNRIPVGIDIPLIAKFKLQATAQGRPKLLTNFTLNAKDKVTGASIIGSFSDIMGE